MKKQSKIFSFLVVVAAFAFFHTAPVRAEEVTPQNDTPRIITLRIEGPQATMLNEQVKVPNGCLVTDTTTNTPQPIVGYKAICALQKASESGLLTYQVTNWTFGYALDAISGLMNAPDWSESWIIRENNMAASVGIADLDVQAGDELLLTYGPWPMEPLLLIIPTTTVQVGDSIALTTQVWNDTTSAFEPTTSNITFSINGTPTDTPNGSLLWTPDTAGLATIFVTTAGKTRSVPFIVTVLDLPTTPANVRIETPTATILPPIFVDVPAQCKVTDTTGVPHVVRGVKAICALQTLQERHVLTYTVVDFGFGLFLDSINGLTTTPDWSQSWILWQNNALAQLGAADLLVISGDELLFTYGTFPMAPLTLIAQPANTTIGTPINFFARYSLDDGRRQERYRGPLTLYINNQVYQSETGTLTWPAEITGAHIAWAEADGKTRSLPIKLLVTSSTTDEPPTPTPVSTSTLPTPETNPGSGAGGNNGGSNGGCAGCSPITFNLPAALQFLGKQQKSSGSFDSGAQTFYTDWAAVAFGADPTNPAAQALRQYLLTDPAPGAKTTDFERHAMALMALGVNPYTDTATNYINKIVRAYDGTQVGDQEQVNDDIFALFPLLRAGYGAEDEMIKNIVAFIVSQEQNQSWGSTDLTAAAMQALAPLQTLPGVPQALASATNFLHTRQQADGSFDHSLDTTSWVMQAIAAMGESATTANWQVNGTSALDYLAKNQQTDGGLRAVNDSISNRVWTTSYGILGAAQKPWLSVLQNFTKPDTTDASARNSASGCNACGGSPEEPTIAPTTTSQTTANTTTKATPETKMVTPAAPGNNNTVKDDTQPKIDQETALIVKKKSEPSVALVRPIRANTHASPTIKITTETARVPPVISATPDMTFLRAPTGTVPLKQTGRDLFESALAVASTLGVYLAWRFVQIVV